ncbi:unnamed protein product [Camellia sinensis]
MEDSVEEQSTVAANAGKSGSKLRYLLRSTTKSKEEKRLFGVRETRSPLRDRGRGSDELPVGVGTGDGGSFHHRELGTGRVISGPTPPRCHS